MHNKKRQRIEIRQEAKGRDRKLAETEDSMHVRLACGRVYRLISQNLADNPYYPPDSLPLKAVELTLMMCERYARYYYHLLIAVRYMSANFIALLPVCLSALAPFVCHSTSGTPLSTCAASPSPSPIAAMCVLLPFVSELVIFALLLLASIHNARAKGYGKVGGC